MSVDRSKRSRRHAPDVSSPRYHLRENRATSYVDSDDDEDCVFNEAKVGETKDIFTSQDIDSLFGTAFDLQHPNEGYSDDDAFVDLPYRVIKQWYLATNRDANAERFGLPPNNSFLNNSNINNINNNKAKHQSPLLLYGWLQPATNKACEKKSIFVEISALGHVCFDRSKQFRGYWIMTSHHEKAAGAAALYWLHEPDTYRPLLNNNNNKRNRVGESCSEKQPRACSQEMLHLDARAQMGVLSNLLDFVFPTEDETDDEKAAQYAALTMTELSRKLPNSFDSSLLFHYRENIVPHLRDAHDVLIDDCTFLQSLQMPLKHGKDVLTQSPSPQQILKLTIAAEQRSNQFPWGESKKSIVKVEHDDNQDKVGPILLMDETHSSPSLVEDEEPVGQLLARHLGKSTRAETVLRRNMSTSTVIDIDTDLPIPVSVQKRGKEPAVTQDSDSVADTHSSTDGTLDGTSTTITTTITTTTTTRTSRAPQNRRETRSTATAETVTPNSSQMSAATRKQLDLAWQRHLLRFKAEQQPLWS